MSFSINSNFHLLSENNSALSLDYEWQRLRNAGEMGSYNSLLRPMKEVEECNSASASKRTLFRDLYCLFQSRSPTPLQPLEKLTVFHFIKISNSIQIYNTQKISEDCLYRSEKNEKFIFRNRTSVLQGTASLPETFVILKLRSRDITVVPPMIAAGNNVEHLDIARNPRLLELSVQLMQSTRLKSMRMDESLYLNLPMKMQNHIQRGLEIGSIQMLHSPEGIRLWYDFPIESKFQGMLFYDEGFYEPCSLLGQLYMTAYKMGKKEDLEPLFSQLPSELKNLFSLYIWHHYHTTQSEHLGEVSMDWGTEHAIEDPFLLCRAIRDSVLNNISLLESSPTPCEKFYELIYELARCQPLDPLWNPEDADWARINAPMNIARAADAYTLSRGDKNEVHACAQRFQEQLPHLREKMQRNALRGHFQKCSPKTLEDAVRATKVITKYDFGRAQNGLIAYLNALGIDFKNAPQKAEKPESLKVNFKMPNLKSDSEEFFSQQWKAMKDLARAAGATILDKIKEVECRNPPNFSRKTLFKDLHDLLIGALAVDLPPLEELNIADLINKDSEIVTALSKKLMNVILSEDNHTFSANYRLAKQRDLQKSFITKM